LRASSCWGVGAAAGGPPARGGGPPPARQLLPLEAVKGGGEMFKREMVIEVCRAFADMIHESPAAAEWTARKMAAILERREDWDKGTAPTSPAAL